MHMIYPDGQTDQAGHYFQKNGPSRNDKIQRYF